MLFFLKDALSEYDLATQCFTPQIIFWSLCTSEARDGKAGTMLLDKVSDLFVAINELRKSKGIPPAIMGILEIPSLPSWGVKDDRKLIGRINTERSYFNNNIATHADIVLRFKYIKKMDENSKLFVPTNDKSKYSPIGEPSDYCCQHLMLYMRSAIADHCGWRNPVTPHLSIFPYEKMVWSRMQRELNKAMTDPNYIVHWSTLFFTQSGVAYN